MVGYREQAPSKNSNHKLRINNEHLSNTTVLAVLRLVPPKAEFELDESSFVQNKFALVHIRWKTPTSEWHYTIPQLWLLKMHPKTHEKYIQFCLTPAAQNIFEQASNRRHPVKQVDMNSNEIEVNAEELLRSQGVFNIVGILHQDPHSGSWRIIVRVVVNDKYKRLVISLRKSQRDLLLEDHKRILKIHEERYKQHCRA